MEMVSMERKNKNINTQRKFNIVSSISLLFSFFSLTSLEMKHHYELKSSCSHAAEYIGLYGLFSQGAFQYETET